MHLPDYRRIYSEIVSFDLPSIHAENGRRYAFSERFTQIALNWFIEHRGLEAPKKIC
jgi:hypothetical protein